MIKAEWYKQGGMLNLIGLSTILIAFNKSNIEYGSSADSVHTLKGCGHFCIHSWRLKKCCCCEDTGMGRCNICKERKNV